jgi:small-conductance mechanosensitive channel
MDGITGLVALVDWRTLVLTLLRIALVVVAAAVGVAVTRRLLGRVRTRVLARELAQRSLQPDSGKRLDTLFRLLQQGLAIAIWVTASLVVLRDIGVEIGPLLASAGIVGLAVGFGAQNLVRDVISGFFIILEDQIRVGDVVVINGTGGLVEQLNFRTTVLRDLAGVVHVFPNGAITTLSNMTHEWSAYVFDIAVAYHEDVDRVIGLLREVGAELRRDPVHGPQLLEEVEVFGVDQFADSAIVIKGRLKTVPIKQWEVGREFRRRVKLAFDLHGVEIPFPQRTVHVRRHGRE